jgi:NADH-quinone oxidoreductase subunit L
MGGEQDIRKMGGLKKYMPITHLTFAIGTFAIAGIPPLAGFFSKDQILASAFAHNPIFWVLGLGGALLTAFYMFRLFYLTFYGSFRGTHEQEHHLHESPKTMTIPLIVLAVCSVFAGFVNVPEVLGGNHWLDRFFADILAGSTFILEGQEHGHLSHTVEYILMAVSVVAVLSVIFYARIRYNKNGHVPAADGESIPGWQKLLVDKYRIDELYDAIVVRPVIAASTWIQKIFETNFFDRIVNGVGQVVILSSRTARFLQTGNVGLYVFAMAIGILAILAANLFLN